ncbi:alanine racemase [Alkalihalobacterium bogoriense]|uniref:alanine racemase n=1 Tax=Alkalihalobacterium bogoriense TaxID=246272 RepID=UPI0004793111|nr:alanine racemase [Alkalihalobacterium bogoriense]
MLRVDTPSLLLDIGKLTQNIKAMQAFSLQHHIALRPHIKTHKSVHIAKLQLKHGAVGITVAKLSEAEVMADAGIENIFIAYPISAPKKLKKLLDLTLQANITVAIDSIEQAKMINEFFQSSNQMVEVWIKVDSGLHRCGVTPGEEALSLAKFITSCSQLRLTGIFTHAGHSYAAKTTDELLLIGEQEAAAVVESALLCEQANIPILHRSVGSTPTYQISGAMAGITEVRPGNAAFFDMVQVGLGVATVEQCALTVLASVVSTKTNRVIVDSGSKTLTSERGAHGNESIKGFGYIKEHPDLTIERLSEEHGILTFSSPHTLQLNDTVEIIPNHACPVVNLFDSYFVHKNGEHIDTWPVDARGCNK